MACSYAGGPVTCPLFWWLLKLLPLLPSRNLFCASFLPLTLKRPGFSSTAQSVVPAPDHIGSVSLEAKVN